MRRLLEHDSISDVPWNLVDYQVETAAVQDEMMLIAESAIHPQRLSVESRDPFQVLHK
jgi:hypothetical protein